MKVRGFCEVSFLARAYLPDLFPTVWEGRSATSSHELGLKKMCKVILDKDLDKETGCGSWTEELYGRRLECKQFTLITN